MTTPAIPREALNAALDYLRTERSGNVPVLPELPNEQWLQIAHDCGLMTNQAECLRTFIKAVFSAVPYGMPYPAVTDAAGWTPVSDVSDWPNCGGPILAAFDSDRVILTTSDRLGDIPRMVTHWKPAPTAPGEEGSGKWFSIYQQSPIPGDFDSVLLADHCGNVTQGIGRTVCDWAERAPTHPGPSPIMFWRHMPEPPPSARALPEN